MKTVAFSCVFLALLLVHSLTRTVPLWEPISVTHFGTDQNEYFGPYYSEKEFQATIDQCNTLVYWSGSEDWIKQRQIDAAINIARINATGFVEFSVPCGLWGSMNFAGHVYNHKYKDLSVCISSLPITTC